MPTSFPVVPTSMTLNDLEPQNRGFSELLTILGCKAYTLRLNCVETIPDRVGQPAYEMLDIKRRFQRCIKRPAPSPPYGCIKFAYPLQNVWFLLLSAYLAHEWLQIDTDLLRTIASTADQLSGRYHRRWPWTILNSRNIGFKWIFHLEWIFAEIYWW